MTRRKEERKKGKKKSFAEFRCHPVWLIPFHYHFHEATFWIQWEQAENSRFRSVISYSVYICDPPPPRVREGVAPIRRIGGRFYAPGIDSEKRNETKRSGLDDRLKEMIEKRLPSCRLIPIFKRNTVSHRDIFDEIPAVVKKYPSNPWLQKLQLDWNGPGGSCPPIPADFQSSKYTLVPFPTFCLYSLPHFSLLLIPVAHRFLHLAVDPAIVIAAAAFAWPLGPRAD